MPAHLKVVFVEDEGAQQLLFSLQRRDEADCTLMERRASAEVLVLVQAMLNRPAFYEEVKKLAVAFNKGEQG